MLIILQTLQWHLHIMLRLAVTFSVQFRRDKNDDYFFSLTEGIFELFILRTYIVNHILCNK